MFYKTIRIFDDEMEEIQKTVVALPVTLLIADVATVQVPIGGVVAHICFDKIIVKKDRNEVDEFLIDEVASHQIDHTLLSQFRLPPSKKGQSIFAGVNADESEIELARP